MDKVSDDDFEQPVVDSLRDATAAMSVRRVFGEPLVLDGVTIVPVARIAGGAAGGGGEGTGSDDEKGGGFGVLFGLGAHPVGVYEIRGDRVDWKPSIDVDRLLRGGQVLAAIAMTCVSVIVVQRCRRGRPGQP